MHIYRNDVPWKPISQHPECMLLCLQGEMWRYWDRVAIWIRARRMCCALVLTRIPLPLSHVLSNLADVGVSQGGNTMCSVLARVLAMTGSLRS